jgi:hypothetical protein
MSELRETPNTDHDLLVRIWTILEGTNGSGLITRFSCLEADLIEVKKLLPSLWTREQHDMSIKELKNKKERRSITRRDIALIAMTIIGPIVAVIIAKYW